MIIRKLVTQLGVETDDKKLKNFDKKIKDLGTSLTKIGAIGTAVGAAIALPIAAVDTNVRRSLTLLDTTEKEYEGLRKSLTSKAQDIGDRLGKSAQQVTSGFYDVISTGAQPTADNFDLLVEKGLQLEELTGLGLPDAVTQISEAMGQFQMDTSETARTVDQLFAATQPVTVQLPQLAQSLRIAGATANDLGFSFGETLGVLDAFAKAGTKDARAGTAFVNIFSRLRAPTDKGRKALKALGISMDQLVNKEGKIKGIANAINLLREGRQRVGGAKAAQLFKDLFEESGSRDFLNLLSVQQSEIQKYIDFVDSADGTKVDQKYKELMGGATGAYKRAASSVINLFTSIGDIVDEDIAVILNGIADLIKSMREFVKENPSLTRSATVLVALASSLTGVGLAFRGLAFLKVGSKLGPFINLLTGFGKGGGAKAAAAGLGMIANTIPKFGVGLTVLSGGFKLLGKVLKGSALFFLLEEILALFDPETVGLLEDAGEAMGQFASGFAEAFSNDIGASTEITPDAVGFGRSVGQDTKRFFDDVQTGKIIDNIGASLSDFGSRFAKKFVEDFGPDSRERFMAERARLSGNNMTVDMRTEVNINGVGLNPDQADRIGEAVGREVQKANRQSTKDLATVQ